MSMRSITASLALLSCGAAPLQAQTIEGAPHLNGAGPVATGGFAGVRLRIPLGGARDSDRDIRASLTLAPMQRSEGAGLRGPAWRFGEGLEVGFTGDEAAPHLSLVGQRLTPAPYAPGRSTPTKGRDKMPDDGTVAVVGGGLALVEGIGLLVALDESGDPDPCTPGECNNN